MQDIQNCTDLLNDQLVGTPIEDVVGKMKEIEPMMAKQNLFDMKFCLKRSF